MNYDSLLVVLFFSDHNNFKTNGPLRTTTYFRFKFFIKKGGLKPDLTVGPES